MAVNFLEPVPTRQGCLNCGPKPQLLRLSDRLSVGFGIVIVTRDDTVIWAGDSTQVSVGMIERLAYSHEHADHHQKRGRGAPLEMRYDWRIKFDAPLSMNEYQRQGRAKWVCVNVGPGFA